MRLLLTSDGLRNEPITEAFRRGIQKGPKELKAIFVTTASASVVEEKTWLVNDIWRVHKQGFRDFDLVDISGLSAGEFLPRIETADVVVFGGGDSFHLMNKIDESGAIDDLRGLLSERFYMGISAGSVAAAPNLSARNKFEKEPRDFQLGFGFVPFYFIPHLNSDEFPERTPESLKELSLVVDRDLYSGSDDVALLVTDGEVEIIGDDYLYFPHDGPLIRLTLRSLTFKTTVRGLGAPSSAAAEKVL